MDGSTSVVGLECETLPDGAIPLEYIVVVKCLNAEGEPWLFMRSSTGLTAWEAGGMVMALTESMREFILEAISDETP